MTVESVISGHARWHVEQADLLTWLPQMPADSVDLCFFSPPYEKARSYGIDFALAGQAWVDWMVKVFHECIRVCNGLVACVCEGQTVDFRWSAVPVLLMADLHRAGFCLRRPPVFYRVGIPGSGGPDWLRGDTEWIVCASRPGKLPWSDNTSCGHPPKWAPGGEMSHRLSDGARVNQWGKNGAPRGMGNKNADGTIDRAVRPSHKFMTMSSRGADGERKIAGGRCITRGKAEGDTQSEDAYEPPVLANPGNVIQETYTAEDVAALLGYYEAGAVRKCNVGGGLMGSNLAHANEAPFPESLATFFVRSFCPPGGICLDPFSGSGTTAAVAVREARRFLGCDIRESQVELTRRRVSGETPTMFAEAP